MFKKIAAVFLFGLMAAACTNTAPSGVSSSAPSSAPSGVTSSNGGGTRALGNLPSVGVSNGRAVQSGVPNGTGNAY